MTHKERMKLAALKGHVDVQVTLAKATVRAAYVRLESEARDYPRGFRDGNRHRAVCTLREMRGIQRRLQEFCKEVNYV